MPIVEESVEVEVPIETAYNQWTQFEQFPSYMDGVEAVTQLDDTHLPVASIGSDREEWDAEITEQVPDGASPGRRRTGERRGRRRSTADANRTKIMLQLAWESDGMVEALGAMLRQDDRAVRAISTASRFIEKRHETGAWRGEVEQPA
jgi:uncharacterized membrane protein